MWKVSSFHKKSQALSNKSAPSSARLFMQYYASTLITLPLSTSAKKTISIKYVDLLRHAFCWFFLLQLAVQPRTSGSAALWWSSTLDSWSAIESLRHLAAQLKSLKPNHTAARSRHGLRDQLDAEELQSTVKELSDLTLTAIDSHSAEEMPSTDTLLRGCQKVLEFWTYSQTFRGISQTSQWP